MKMQFVKVYCINLNRSPDRMQFMDAQFKKLDLEYERVPAYDGSNFTLSELEDGAIAERVSEWPNLLTPNAIACAKSHVLACKLFVESRAEFALILEDDIRLSTEIVGVIEPAARGLPEGACGLVYWHGDRKTFLNQNSVNLGNGFALHQVQSPWGAYTAGGYIIGRSAAIKLIEFNDPVYTTADSWGVYCREGVITGLWGLLPPLTSAAEFASDIGYSLKSRFGRKFEQWLPAAIAGRMRQSRTGRVRTEFELVNGSPIPLPPPERSH